MSGETVTRRTRSRRGEGEKLRAEIMQSALDLLFETGDAEAVSIRAVAERVGVTPPSIYLHFADKNELLLAVCEQQFAQLDRATGEAAKAAADDPVSALREMGRAYVRFGLEHPEHYRILFMHKPWLSDIDHIDRLRTASGFDRLVEAVADCMDAGAVAAGDPFVTALTLWVAVHGVTSLLISKPDFPWPPHEELVDHIMDVQLRGLRP